MSVARISVIIPCYNQARFLPEALASVQAQTFEDWECIIVDDGSPDNTAEVATALASADPRVRLITQRNRGLSGARNRGLLEARGEYIQFLDADDLIESEKFAWQVGLLRRNPDWEIVYSDVRYFPADAPQQRRFAVFGPDEPWLERAWSAPRPLMDKLLQGNLMAVNCPLVRHSVIKAVGPFDEDLRAVEDWHYWLRCAATGVVFQFSPAPNTLALVRIHRQSMSQDKVRMGRATFEMVLRTGRVLNGSGLRQTNFDLGVGRLRECRYAFEIYHLARLTWANRCPSVARALLRALASRHRVGSKLLNLCRRAR